MVYCYQKTNRDRSWTLRRSGRQAGERGTFLCESLITKELPGSVPSFLLLTWRGPGPRLSLDVDMSRPTDALCRSFQAGRRGFPREVHNRKYENPHHRVRALGDLRSGIMKQAYTSQTNPATLITLHPEFPVNLISLAGGFIPGDTDLILPGGGIIQLALETIGFPGAFLRPGRGPIGGSYVLPRSGDTAL